MALQGSDSLDTSDALAEKEHIKMDTIDMYEKIADSYPNLSGVMIGRGAIKNPAIFRGIRGGVPLATEELVAFSDRLSDVYYKALDSEVFTLQKLKEV